MIVLIEEIIEDRLDNYCREKLDSNNKEFSSK